MHRTLLTYTLCFAAVAVASGCGDSGTPDGGGGDSGPGHDGSVDAGVDMTPGVDLGLDAGPPPTARTGRTNGGALAISDDDHVAVAANRGAQTVSVLGLDLAGTTPIGSNTTLDVPGLPWAAVIGNDGNTAFVILRAAARVVRIDNLRTTPTMSTLGADVGSEPTGIAISPTGRTLYVANWGEGTVSVVDAVSMTVSSTVDLNAPLAASGALGTVSPRPGLAHPRAIVVTNSGDTNDGDETIYVTEYFAQRAATGVPTGDAQFDQDHEGIVYSVSAGSLAVGSLIHLGAVADTGFTDSVGNTTGCFPNQLQTVALANGRLYVGALCESPRGPIGPVLDPATNTPTNTDNFKTQIHTSIFVVDTATNTELAAQRLVLTQAFRDHYVTAGRADDASRRNPLIATDMAFVNASSVLYLTSYGSDAVFRVRYNADGTLAEVGSTMADFIDLAPTAGTPPPAGRLPIGLAIANALPMALTLNENTRNASVIALTTQSVSTAVDVTPKPTAGSPEDHALTGRRFFVTGLARWSFKGQAWNSCESCHGDGLTDNVTWYFARGPRQSISLDGTYDSADATQQRLLNWTALFDEVHDFELNTRGNSGGVGAIVHTRSTPPAASDRIHFDGTTPVPPGAMATATPQNGLNGSTRSMMPGGATTPSSVADDWNNIDAWIQTIRSPRAPVGLDAGDVAMGRMLFETNNCAGCHGTHMWTISRRFYTPNETNDNPMTGLLRSTMYTRPSGFPAALNPPSMASGSALLRFPAGATAGANDQIQCILRAVGTFGTAPTGGVVVDEVRQDMTTAAQGTSGFNPPALLAANIGAPYYHAGNARTLEEVFDPAFDAHATALSTNFLVTGDRPTQVRQIVAFLLSIDESTTTAATPALPYDPTLCPGTL